MSALSSSSKHNSSKSKGGSVSNFNASVGGRTGIPTLRSLRTLFAPASQVKSTQVSPSRPSLNLHVPKSSSDLMHSRSSLNIHNGNDTSSSTSSLDVVRRSMTLGRKGSGDPANQIQARVEADPVMDIRSSSPEVLEGGGVDLSTIVEADTSGVSGMSLAESLSKHLPALPTANSPSPSGFHSHSRSPSPAFSPSPSPKPPSASASASSLHLPRSPSSIHAQVHSALQVDPALAALLSPNNLSSSNFSPGSESAPSSPGASRFSFSIKPKSRTSLYPQHASTPHSSLRMKNVSHLGLIQPSYIRSPSPDESRSFAASMSRPGSSASAARSGKGINASVSADCHTSSAPRIRMRSMSVDERSLRHTPGSSLISSRRNTSDIDHRPYYTAHAQNLSQSGNLDLTQSEAGDKRPPSQRTGHRRPPISEWLGPRTAKAFKAAGLLASESNHIGSVSSQQLYSYFDTNSPSLSAPSSPVRPKFRPASSYTSDVSYSPNSPSPSPPYPLHVHAPHPRAASVAASAISARSSGSVRSSSIRSGSVRSASTAPTSLSTNLGPAQAAREYLKQSQTQQQKIVSSFSSSTLNLPTSTSVSLSSTALARPSELQLLKDQHSTETSALLAALSDAQRNTRLLRVENAELREALQLSESKQDSWKREMLHLKSQVEEFEAQLEATRGLKRENLKKGEEIRVLHKMKAELELKLDEAEGRVMQAEGKLCIMDKIKNTNHKLRQSLHLVQRKKAEAEAEAEMRTEEALRRIEQLENALAEASGAIGATIRIAKASDGTEFDISPNENSSNVDHGATDSFSSHFDSWGGLRSKSGIRTSHESSPPSSESSSRPPSIFPVPPENMSLLMHEEAEVVTPMGERSTLSELDESPSLETNRVEVNRKMRAELDQGGGDAECINLDAIEFKWRQSMDTSVMNGHPSTSKYMSRSCHNSVLASSSNPNSGLKMTGSPKQNLLHEYDYSHTRHNSSSCSILSNDNKYDDEDQAIVGNTPYGYDAEGAENDSIISEDDDDLQLLGLDGHEPTVRAYLHSNSSLNTTHIFRSGSPLKLETMPSSIETRGFADLGNEDDDTTTSFEGTGTPGSPGSLLWLHPLDDRHLGDLSGSVDSLRLSGG